MPWVCIAVAGKVYWYSIQSSKKKKWDLKKKKCVQIPPGQSTPSKFLLGWGSEGQVEHDRLRPCSTLTPVHRYSTSKPPAHDCTFNQWYSKVTHFCKEVPIILTGWKTGLHKDKSQVKKLQKTVLEPVTYPRGQETAKAMPAGDTWTAQPGSAKMSSSKWPGWLSAAAATNCSGRPGTLAWRPGGLGPACTDRPRKPGQEPALTLLRIGWAGPNPQAVTV